MIVSRNTQFLTLLWGGGGCAFLRWEGKKKYKLYMGEGFIVPLGHRRPVPKP